MNTFDLSSLQKRLNLVWQWKCSFWNYKANYIIKMNSIKKSPNRFEQSLCAWTSPFYRLLMHTAVPQCKRREALIVLWPCGEMFLLNTRRRPGDSSSKLQLRWKLPSHYSWKVGKATASRSIEHLFNFEFLTVSQANVMLN